LVIELPNGASLTPAVDITRDRSINGSGNIRRGEKITLRLAAQVSGVMPNGYLAVKGPLSASHGLNSHPRYFANE